MTEQIKEQVIENTKKITSELPEKEAILAKETGSEIAQNQLNLDQAAAIQTPTDVETKASTEEETAQIDSEEHHAPVNVDESSESNTDSSISISSDNFSSSTVEAATLNPAKDEFTDGPAQLLKSVKPTHHSVLSFFR